MIAYIKNLTVVGYSANGENLTHKELTTQIIRRIFPNVPTALASAMVEQTKVETPKITLDASIPEEIQKKIMDITTVSQTRWETDVKIKDNVSNEYMVFKIWMKTMPIGKRGVKTTEALSFTTRNGETVQTVVLHPPYSLTLMPTNRVEGPARLVDSANNELCKGYQEGPLKHSSDFIGTAAYETAFNSGKNCSLCSKLDDCTRKIQHVFTVTGFIDEEAVEYLGIEPDMVTAKEANQKGSGKYARVTFLTNFELGGKWGHTLKTTTPMVKPFLTETVLTDYILSAKMETKTFSIGGDPKDIVFKEDLTSEAKLIHALFAQVAKNRALSQYKKSSQPVIPGEVKELIPDN